MQELDHMKVPFEVYLEVRLMFLTSLSPRRLRKALLGSFSSLRC